MSTSKSIKDLISLKGKVSIVTGGAGHLGSVISEALAELGSDIIIVGKRKEIGLNFAGEISKKYGIRASFEDVDLNSKDSIDSFFQKNQNNIDILVNNAFTWPSIVKLEDTTWEDFEN